MVQEPNANWLRQGSGAGRHLIAMIATGVIAAFVLIGNPVPSRPLATGLAAIHVPRGFKVEKVAGSDLGSYPMMGTIDDRGRLFVCESSGNTLTTAQMAAKPDYHIRMLEDTNGDGIYDRSTISRTEHQPSKLRVAGFESSRAYHFQQLRAMRTSPFTRIKSG